MNKCEYVQITIGHQAFNACRTAIVAIYENFSYIKDYAEAAKAKVCEKLGLKEEETAILGHQFLGSNVLFIGFDDSVKKYEFTGATRIITVDGREVTLRRIRSLKHFNGIKAGDIGGWIEKEENLSHEGNCWVAEEACVFDDARVSGNAQVFENAYVYENAQVTDRSYVFGSASVFGRAKVCEQGKLSGDARMMGDVILCKNAHLTDNTIYGR